MSRVPPGGRSSIVFGASAESKPAAKTAEATDIGGEIPDEEKAIISRLIRESATAEELLAKLTEEFGEAEVSFSGPPATTGDTLTPRAIASTRGFKPATAKVEGAVDKLKASLAKRGCDSIMRLGKRFRIMDDDGSHGLCFDELKKGLIETSAGLSEAEMQALFRYVDADCSGYVSFDEFLSAVRGQLNDRRAALVGLAFEAMDMNGDGALTVDDLASRYDVTHHPDVVSGLSSERDVLENFLMGFDGSLGVKTKIITPDRFAAYYANVSASIEDDDYFELMIRNVWHLSGGEGQYENTTCRRLLVTHADGTSSVEEIANDIDVSKDDLVQMKARLRDQGMDVIKISLYGEFSDEEGAPMTTSPKKKQPAPMANDGGVAAYGYKARMSSSSVTFA